MFCRCFADSSAERDEFYVRKIQNGSKKVAKTINMESKGYQSEPRDLRKNPWGTGSKIVVKRVIESR